jgi:hypothetical protein
MDSTSRSVLHENSKTTEKPTDGKASDRTATGLKVRSAPRSGHLLVGSKKISEIVKV